MKLSYYPGCSPLATSKEYNSSTKAVCRALNIELIELPDWNCCGATSAHYTSHELSITLGLRNLIIAQKQGWNLVTICAACFNRLKIAQAAAENNPGLKKQVEEIVGYSSENKANIKVKHLLEIIRNDIGFDAIKQKVTRPLRGLKIAVYYGCLLVRPRDICQFDDQENPLVMDQLMETLGAEPLKWSCKTECCGGSLSTTRRDVVIKLVAELLDMAAEAGANCIVTACPLCAMNLEMRGQRNNKMPVFYFSELLGLALGIEKTHKWFSRHLVSPGKLLDVLK